jgi:hypothetical protein
VVIRRHLPISESAGTRFLPSRSRSPWQDPGPGLDRARYASARARRESGLE